MRDDQHDWKIVDMVDGKMNTIDKICDINQKGDRIS